MLRNQIEKNLAALSRLPINDSALERAAVVIAVVDGSQTKDTPYFLLTRRASKLRKHAGQFALPGGKVDPGESIEQAALRELEEELGIVLTQNDVLGKLDDYPTRSGFCISPIVVWLSHTEKIVSNPDEVAEVFEVPLTDLDQPDLVNLERGESAERPVLSIKLRTIGHEIYAPTAAIIYQFYEVAMRQNETRVAFYDGPTFAWK